MQKGSKEPGMKVLKEIIKELQMKLCKSVKKLGK